MARGSVKSPVHVPLRLFPFLRFPPSSLSFCTCLLIILKVLLAIVKFIFILVSSGTAPIKDFVLFVFAIFRAFLDRTSFLLIPLLFARLLLLSILASVVQKHSSCRVVMAREIVNAFQKILSDTKKIVEGPSSGTVSTVSGNPPSSNPRSSWNRILFIPLAVFAFFPVSSLSPLPSPSPSPFSPPSPILMSIVSLSSVRSSSTRFRFFTLPRPAASRAIQFPRASFTACLTERA
ncbi:hypothetical protein OF83DRAFT_868981 [Amylostereum chailletii]|nr:hypothetical protein OF83DRAFT_868981 [Amylostereum chailletii]